MTTDNIIVHVCYYLDSDRGVACIILEQNLLYPLRVTEIKDGESGTDEGGEYKRVYFEVPRDKAIAFFEEYDKEKTYD